MQNSLVDNELILEKIPDKGSWVYAPARSEAMEEKTFCVMLGKGFYRWILDKSLSFYTNGKWAKAQIRKAIKKNKGVGLRTTKAFRGSTRIFGRPQR